MLCEGVCCVKGCGMGWRVLCEDVCCVKLCECVCCVKVCAVGRLCC